VKLLALTALALLLLASPCSAQTNRNSWVQLAWTPSTTTNTSPITYRVYWGVVSHTYTNYLSAGTNLTLNVTNLARGSTYFFAATALDIYSLESDFSSEVWWASPTQPLPPTILRIITGN
jgi:hypothetical protein